MARIPRVRFSHIGIHVHDIDVMVDFYTGLLGLEITDRGRLPLAGEPEIVFLSADPEEHHQIALVEGRQDGGIEGGVVNQLSFGSLALGRGNPGADRGKLPGRSGLPAYREWKKGFAGRIA